MPFSTEKAKRAVVLAGPMARINDAAVWASPFVLPKRALDGAAFVIITKIHPSDRVGILCQWESWRR